MGKSGSERDGIRKDNRLLTPIEEKDNMHINSKNMVENILMQDMETCLKNGFRKMS